MENIHYGDDKLIERLRAKVSELEATLTWHNRNNEACTDDSALIQACAERDRYREVLLVTAASLAAAISLLERGSKKAAPSDKMFDQMIEDYRKSLAVAREALNR